MRIIAAIACLLLNVSAMAQQTYPNIDGETLLEDDRVVVQRFVLQPGEWEGIHEHPEHQLVIVLKPTNSLTYRRGDSERVFEREDDNERVTAFWRPGPVFLSDQHESGNTGDKPLEWVAITFKGESIATDTPPARFVAPTENSGDESE